MSTKPLKKFTSTNEVTPEYLWELLDLWEKGEIDEVDLLDFAEEIFDKGPGFPSYPFHDIRYIVVAVLDALATMYSNPTTKDDIPALKASLRLGSTSPEKAAEFLHDYWKTVDWDTRLQAQLRSIKGERQT